MKIDTKQIGRKVTQSITISVDMSAVQREVFGIFKWRLTTSRALFWMASKILRVPVEVT